MTAYKFLADDINV